MRSANAAAEAMFGLPAGGLPGAALAALVPDEDRALVEGALDDLRRGEQVDGTARGQRADGAAFPLRVHAVSLGEPAPRAALLLLRDLTEPSRMEARLADAEDRLAAARRVARIGYWEWSVEADRIAWSDELYPIYGVTPETFDHTYPGFLALLHPEDRGRLMQAVQDAITAGTAYTVEHRVVRPDGEVRWCASSGRGRVGPDGAMRHLYGMSQDITPLKQAEEERLRLEQEVQQAQKLESLGVLAGGIAHDFNNMLMGILGNVSLALDGVAAGSAVREDLLAAQDAALRASELCRQLLAYAGRARLEKAPTDVSALVDGLRDLLRVSVSKGAELRFALAPDLPAVVGDATQLGQVVMNLVINASEALGGGVGAVEVATRLEPCTAQRLARAHVPGAGPPGDHVVVEVSDAGQGMGPERIGRMFEPFYTTKFTGRGLGMAAVMGIVRGHGGAIEVESAPGAGTTVRVLLPASGGAAAAAREPARAARPEPLRGLVLLVDDDPLVRTTAARMLGVLGLDVVVADGPDAGVERFREHAGELSLVLLDMTMPGRSGHDVYREIRALDPHARVLLSSGYDEREVTEPFADEGLAGFLQKPYSLEGLRRAIDRALRTDPATR